MNSAKMKLVYAIAEHNQRHVWNRVGVGFVNHDGSINIKLQALPVNGELQIRDYAEPSAPTLRSPVSSDAASS